MVSTKCLQEINRLRHVYRTDLSQPSVQSTAQKRKRTLTAVLSDTPHPKRTRVTSFGTQRKAESVNEDKQLPPTKRSRTSHHTPPEIQSWYRYNPVSEVWQRQVCTPGGPNVRLRHPMSLHKVRGDGNCLLHALCYVITGSERQPFKLHSLIVEHLRSTEACMRLLTNYIVESTIEHYIAHSCMDQRGIWCSTTEILVIAHLLGINIASYNSADMVYQVLSPGVIDFEAFQEDYFRPTIYTGNHLDVVQSQE